MTQKVHSETKILQPWEILKAEDVFVAEPWIRLSVEKIRLPDGRIIDDYYQMQLIDCVIIFAETRGGKVVVERQYKHGVRKVTLTLPMGGVGKGEDPLLAAQREFKEETGYMSQDWRPLGQFVQMGNQGGGTVHIFRARSAEKVTDPVPSDLEEMDIILMDRRELIEAIRNRDICVLNTVTSILMATHPDLSR